MSTWNVDLRPAQAIDVIVCVSYFRLDFTITADGGNREHWQYSVEYVERLSHWPHTLNKNTGTISVKKVTKPNELFLIESETKTCFLFGLYCCK